MLYGCSHKLRLQAMLRPMDGSFGIKLTQKEGLEVGVRGWDNFYVLLCICKTGLEHQDLLCDSQRKSKIARHEPCVLSSSRATMYTYRVLGIQGSFYLSDAAFYTATLSIF